jgi:hypothetical protein
MSAPSRGSSVASMYYETPEAGAIEALEAQVALLQLERDAYRRDVEALCVKNTGSRFNRGARDAEVGVTTRVGLGVETKPWYRYPARAAGCRHPTVRESMGSSTLQTLQERPELSQVLDLTLATQHNRSGCCGASWRRCLRTAAGW